MTERITVEEYRKQARKSLKYGNKIVKYKGMTFHSIGETERYKELELLQLSTAIYDLKRQVKFDLMVKNERVGVYIADFTYKENRKNYGPILVIEDFKGAETPLFKLKWAIMKAIHCDCCHYLRITRKQRGRK